MSRKLKNIIAVVIIILLVVASGFTIKLAKDSKENGNGQQMQMPQMKQGQGQNENGNNQGTPPSKPDGNSNEQQNANGNSSNQETPPEKPEGDSNSNSSNQNTPPSKPEGDSNEQQDTNNQQGTNDQQSTNNQQQMGQPQEMPQMENKEAKLDISYYILFGIEAFVISAIIAYLVVTKFNKNTISADPQKIKQIAIMAVIIIILTAGLTYAQIYITSKTQGSQTQMQGPGANGGQNANISYTATKEITESETINSGEYTSSESNQNALLASGDIEANVSNVTVEKTGDSDGGDSSNFYGNNSAVIAKDGANLTLENIDVTTNASGANGVFSYGGSATTNNSSSDGTTVTISDSTINTTGDNAGGIMTTGGGTTNATNLTINTKGTSSAAIRSDRGGGTVNVNKGTYTTEGKGSPAIYSTANITATNATLEAKASEGIVIEGANTVSIENCKLTDSNTSLNGQSTTYKNIFLYQSMSGDASNGTAKFTAKNSQITTNKGDTFYITNTTATIDLNGNTIINNDSEGNFLRAQKDSWGNSGSNGGKVTLKMTNQKANGNIVIDSISTLDMEMTESSYYEGTINGENQAKSITLKLDSSSKIKLTGDSYVTSLEDADTSYSNIDFNGYTLYVNGTAIN